MKADIGAGGTVLRTLPLLRALSGAEWRHHPGRQFLAVLAVALGVALAFSVHLINESALSEFSSAVRSANGEPDASLQCGTEGCDERVHSWLAHDAAVRLATPLLEVETVALPAEVEVVSQAEATPRRVGLRVLGLDALSIAEVAPDLLPRPFAAAQARPAGSETAASADEAANDDGALVWLDPQALFLSPSAMQALRLSPTTAAGSTSVRLMHGASPVSLRLRGTLAAGGTPMAVMDIAGAQAAFGRPGRITRVDLRLEPGATASEVLARLRSRAAGDASLLPAGARLVQADDGAQRVSTASRAYRVNLTVLALVALFVGAFLVFSMQALSVAQRTPTLALLGVLGLSPQERRRWVLGEAVLVGALGSALGLALGTAAAAAALRWLAGDLGGGYFPGIAPALQFSAASAAVFGALGVVAAVVGGWLPARQAAALVPAQALKGLGGLTSPGGLGTRLIGPGLMVLGGALALLPPWGGLPVAAYIAVALLLVGGIVTVPWAVQAVLGRWHPRGSALALLAVERARHERQAATVAVAGVVASLSLSVALTVMVASFRDGVARWLEDVLPADVYVRTAGSSAMAEALFLPDALLAELPRTPGLARAEPLRQRPMLLNPELPAVVLVARPLAEVGTQLPLVGPSLPVREAERQGLPGVYVTEAVERLYGAGPGQRLVLPVSRAAVEGSTHDSTGGSANGSANEGLTVLVLGVWRDYARQFGAIAMDLSDYRRLTGDARVNDLALWLQPDATAEAVQAELRGTMQRLGQDPAALEFAVPGQIRAISMRIFDRSFAVTHYLQALAIGIGLFGIAASFSSQVLARRREFGLLRHLGLTRTQVIAVVTGEGAAWTAAGALAGLGLGVLVSAVLVHVVNPQSFHWTMEMRLPIASLAALCAAVVVAGTLTAALSARRAASLDMVRAVREDW